MKVIVLGAGVIGVSTAWFLCRMGHEVVVVDRQADVALETSYANGGQISVSQSEPWANPAAPLKVLQWLGQSDAPLLFRPKADPRQWGWGIRFLRECLPGRSEHNMRQMVNLGLYSRQTLQQLRRETGIQYDQQTAGILQLYFSQADFDHACQAAELIRDFGCLRSALSPTAAMALEPALCRLDGRLIGATYAEDDEAGDARIFCQQLASMAARQGVQFRFNTCVLGLQRDGGKVGGIRVRGEDGQVSQLHGDAYVLALGSYSPLLTRPLGIHLPIYPTKGYSATLEINGHEGAPQISLTDDAYKMVFTRLGSRMRIAGTAELNGYSTDLNPVRCQALTKRYFELFPDSADPSTVQYWTGLRPSTPSNVPIIGRSPLTNLYFNTGHGTLGWTEGPGSGRALAELINGQQPELSFRFVGF